MKVEACARSPGPSLVSSAPHLHVLRHFLLWDVTFLSTAFPTHLSLLIHLFMPMGMYVRAQLCLTLCDPLDCSPPGSSGIFQARILE